MARFEKQIYRLRPWYHDFEALGVTTCFKGTRRYGLLGPWRPGISGHVEKPVRILDRARNVPDGENLEQIAGSFYLVATGKDSAN